MTKQTIDKNEYRKLYMLTEHIAEGKKSGIEQCIHIDKI